MKPLTLRSLLQPHFRPQVRDEVYRFCASQDCDLVYYRVDGSQTFTRSDLTVRVGLKERSAPRPLCYCFNHSAESIQEEWARTGKTTVAAAIKAELKAGGCHCEVTNPAGGCCLGDVIKEVKVLTSTVPAPAPGRDCCTTSHAEASGKPQESCALPPPRAGEKGQRTIWASIGLGVLASACCWVPLALAGAGVATGTLGARIAWIRPWALGTLVVLLLGVLGWWARKHFASTKADCCTEAPKFPTLAVVILMASFVLAWATPRLLHRGGQAVLTAVAPAGSTLLVISTPQFDCAPCAGNLPKTMAATPGVASVQMDFDQRETRIVFQPGTAVETILARWKKDLGFEGREVRRETV